MLHIFSFAALTTETGLESGIDNTVTAQEMTDPAALLHNAKIVALDFIPRICGALALIIVAHFAVKLIVGLAGRLLKKSKVDQTLHHFILALLKNSIRVMVIIAALLILKFPASPLVTVIGSVGLALSLALKDSLANLAGGISILFNHPFAEGDSISVKDVSGTVKAIDLVYTIITAENGDTIYLPNGDVAKSIVTNFTSKKNPPQSLE